MASFFCPMLILGSVAEDRCPIPLALPRLCGVYPVVQPSLLHTVCFCCSKMDASRYYPGWIQFLCTLTFQVLLTHCSSFGKASWTTTTLLYTIQFSSDSIILCFFAWISSSLPGLPAYCGTLILLFVFVVVLFLCACLLLYHHCKTLYSISR